MYKGGCACAVRDNEFACVNGDRVAAVCRRVHDGRSRIRLAHRRETGRDERQHQPPGVHHHQRDSRRLQSAVQQYRYSVIVTSSLRHRYVIVTSSLRRREVKSSLRHRCCFVAMSSLTRYIIAASSIFNVYVITTSSYVIVAVSSRRRYAVASSDT